MTARCIVPIFLLLIVAWSVDALPKTESITVTSLNPDLTSTKSSEVSTSLPETKPDDVSQSSTTIVQELEYSTKETNTVTDHTEEATSVPEPVSSEYPTATDNVNTVPNDSPPWKAVVHSTNQFALNLYKVVRPEDGSVLISPLSVSMVLGMLWLGSGGKTAVQIAEALSLPENDTDVNHGFQELSQSLQKDQKSNITLDIASKLYADNMFTLNDQFHNSVKKSFLADAEQLNFVANSDIARISINQWVEEHTQSRIKELLQEGVVNTDTKVVIVNAVYFKGFWKNQFMKEFTHDMPFHLINGSVAFIPTMLAIGDFPTANMQHLNCTVIKLPYEGSVSLLVFLPRSRSGLPTLEENLQLQDIEDIIPKLENVELHLYFPKFNLKFSTELEDAFKKLGIDDVFQTNANLTGISPVTGLSVTHILHKTFLEVTEEGSEASAASAAILDIRGGTLSINVHYPFMFAIRDDETGAILFLGNYRGPE